MTITARLTLAMVLLALLTAAMVGILTYRRLEAAILPVELARLQEHASGQATLIDEVIAAARHDVRAFMNGAAAFDGIARARSNGGIDPQDGATEQVWCERLARRFVAELQAKNDYVQMRFIGLADGGREIVRVSRSGPEGQIRIVPGEELQRKGDRDYFADTIRLPKGTIHVSRIDLNEEQGQIAEPPVPVIRIATPILAPSGEPFGIVVLNVDLRPLFSRVSRTTGAQNRMFIVNERGDFLLHPQPERMFGFQRGSQDGLQKDFPALASTLGKMAPVLRLMELENGQNQGVAVAPFHLGGDGEWLGVIEMAPEASLLATLAPVRHSNVMAGGMVALIAAALGVWLARSLARPVVTLTRSVEAFGAGESRLATVNASGEIGQLARAFDKMREEIQEQTSALRYSEELFGKSFQLSPECVLITRLSDRTVIRANDELCRLWGTTPTEVIGKLAPEFSSWLNEEERVGFLRTLTQNGECLGHETTLKLNDGRLRRFNISARVITLNHDPCILTAMHDVTDRQRIEVAAAQLAAIVESSDDAIIGIDLSGNVTSWNSGATKLFGQTAAEMIGQPIMRLVPPERQPEEAMLLEQIRRGGNVRPFDTVRRRQNGEIVDVSITVSAIRDSLGNVVGASKVARDITDRMQAATALRTSEGRYRALFEYAPDGIIIANPQGAVLDGNVSICRMLGYSHQELMGIPWSQAVAPNEAAQIEGALQAVNARSDYHREWLFRRKDGSTFAAEVIATAMPDGNLLAVIRDITERKLAEAALQGSEDRFRTMANSMPQLSWIARADGYIVWYNQRWYEYTGTTSENMVGRGWQSVHDPEVLPQVVENWTRGIREGKPFEMEFPLRGANGRFRSFLTRVQPVRDAQGVLIQWLGTNTDIEKLKRMEKSLRATQARLNSTLAAGSIGTWTWNLEEDCLVGDEFTAQVFSLDPGDTANGLPAAAYLQSIVEEDRPGVAAGLESAIEQCGFYDMEYRVRQKDGSFLWLQARGRVEGNRAGKAVHFHGAVVDITARKLAEAIVKESEEHFRFLNDLGEATRTIAETGQITTVVTKTLGEHLHAARCAYAEVAAEGEQFSILHDYTDGCASTVGQYQLMRFGERVAATLRRGETVILRDVGAELRPTEGADMFQALGIQAAIICPLVKDGRLRAMIGVHQSTPRDWKPNEITIVHEVVHRCWAMLERRTAEEKIHQLNAQLEQRVVERTAQLEAANKELEAFSYSISHDLRAPLRAIDGFSQAVLDDFGEGLPDEGRRYLKTIRGAAQRMGALIDDLLAFSRLGRHPLSKRVVDTGKLVQATLHELGAPWMDRRVELRVHDLPPCTGEPALLKQVWVNLLSNALKYSRKRDIAVIEIGCDVQNETRVYFVKDNGSGFDMRYAGALFGVFQRLHRAEEFEGTGVGLAIVQRIVQRHGGRIWAEAEVDVGAAFYFTLGEEPIS